MQNRVQRAIAAGVLTFGTVASAAWGQPTSEACAELRGLSVAPEEIGLPSAGADISAAEVMTLDDGTEYCRALGHVDPVDEAAPDINLQVNLPLDWNSKAVHFGGSGYNGELREATGNVRYGADDAATPLERGYVTFGSDSGHQSTSSLDARFMLNEEALVNFGGDQLKKTHDVAMALARAFYGAEPERVYFQGSSQGGHEGMIAIQRWPDDYEGALITHPANPFVGLQLSGNAAARALYAPGAWVSPHEVELLNEAVMRACDRLDGAEDGLIGNTAACARTFDVESLRCEAGEDGAGCLSDAQIGALRAINTRYEAPATLQGGATGFARWPIFEGGDLHGLWGMGQRPEPSVPPTPVQDFGLHVLADALIRYGILQDPEADTLDFVPEEHAARIVELSEIMDAVDPDLSAFADRGGKALMMHGTTDFAITPHNTTEYYQRVVDTMGQARADEFLRYYVVPGFGHGSGAFQIRWDPLSALEAWVEEGRAPEGLVATDAAKPTAGRTRPLCEYPAFPRRKERATDLDAAESFVCATE